MTLSPALLQRFKALLPHRYAIDAKALGDASTLPWSNLGYWQAGFNYRQACQYLADHLAHTIGLSAQQRVLDVGCGQGASLLHWRQAYGLTDITGVELQPLHVKRMQARLPRDMVVYESNYVDLDQCNLPVFDAVLCIDAAYHQPLLAFLQAIDAVTQQGSRVGLHYLMLSPTWYQLSPAAQKAYAYWLKAADVSLEQLLNAQQIQTHMARYAWQIVEIEDLTDAVLAGFARYMLEDGFAANASVWSAFKIRMTAKLCGKLARDGYVRYVQISANKI